MTKKQLKVAKEQKPFSKYWSMDIFYFHSITFSAHTNKYCNKEVHVNSSLVILEISWRKHSLDMKTQHKSWSDWTKLKNGKCNLKVRSSLCSGSKSLASFTQLVQGLCCASLFCLEMKFGLKFRSRTTPQSLPFLSSAYISLTACHAHILSSYLYVAIYYFITLIFYQLHCIALIFHCLTAICISLMVWSLLIK